MNSFSLLALRAQDRYDAHSVQPIIFKRMGKHPLAGLVLGYAATTAGFTANLVPAGTDVLLAAITTRACAGCILY